MIAGHIAGGTLMNHAYPITETVDRERYARDAAIRVQQSALAQVLLVKECAAEDDLARLLSMLGLEGVDA